MKLFASCLFEFDVPYLRQMFGSETSNRSQVKIFI